VPAAPGPGAEDVPMEAAPREAVEETLVEDVAEDPTAVAEPAQEPVAIAAPPVDAPTSTAEQAEPAVSDGIHVDTVERTQRERPVKRTKPVVQPRVIAAPAPVVAPVTTSAVTVRVTAGTNQNTIAPDDRFHVVQRGESLWSIATDMLGERAGVAEIAGEVDRLWQINEDRIASGSPDLLYTGTRLHLR
jgi:nucleoid-associated protein YgaU